jgi:hypothetical protein
MAKLLKNTFKAWINKMPGSQPKLIVTGKAEVPTTGWSGSLERAVPQGINPRILILDACLVEPTGKVNQLVSEVDLRFEESPPANEYTDVTVRLDGDEVTVKVDIVV